MKSAIIKLIIISSILLTPAIIAQEQADAQIKFPHIAEVTGTDVYVRSGPGTAYYFCGKISKPSKVIVVDHKYSWIKIVPPKGSFSWIAKEYVTVDENSKEIGILNADNVRVYAGSPHIPPEQSYNPQTTLNKGDSVRLTGTVSGDYYQIVPPADAYLWISNQYLKYHGPMPEEKTQLPEPEILPQPKAKIPEAPEPEKQTEPEKMQAPIDEPQVEPKPEQPEQQAQPTAQKPTQTETPEPAEVTETITRPTGPGYDNKMINTVLDISELIDAELQKPLEEQGYEKYLQQLRKIAHDAKAEKAQLYAQFQINRIERYQLAKKAAQQLDKQEKNLEQKKQEILKKRRAATVPKQQQKGKYIAEGIIKPSYIYTEATGSKRYIILEPTGQVACYAIPTYNLSKTEIEKHIGQKVGLIGSAIHDRYSPTSLVEFSDIVPLD